MRGKIIVFNMRKIIISTLIVSVLMILCFIGTNVVRQTITVTAQKKMLPIYSVETSNKVVALTFDCAWGAQDIPEIIAILQANDVKATFFTVGSWVDKFPEAVEALSNADMEIGNHSNSHAHVNKLSYGENLEDMTKCNDKIEAITDTKVKYYRGPYGEYNNTVISVAKELGMQVIQWDVDTLDYEGKTVEEMCQRIKKKIRNRFDYSDA